MLSQKITLDGVETHIAYWSSGREFYVEEITREHQKVKLETHKELELIEKLFLKQEPEVELYFHHTLMEVFPPRWSGVHRRSQYLTKPENL